MSSCVEFQSRKNSRCRSIDPQIDAACPNIPKHRWNDCCRLDSSKKIEKKKKPFSGQCQKAASKRRCTTWQIRSDRKCWIEINFLVTKTWIWETTSLRSQIELINIWLYISSSIQYILNYTSTANCTTTGVSRACKTTTCSRSSASYIIYWQRWYANCTRSKSRIGLLFKRQKLILPHIQVSLVIHYRPRTMTVGDAPHVALFPIERFLPTRVAVPISQQGDAFDRSDEMKRTRADHIKRLPSAYIFALEIFANNSLDVGWLTTALQLIGLGSYRQSRT